MHELVDIRSTSDPANGKPNDGLYFMPAAVFSGLLFALIVR
jgi:hypothetical protein